MDFNDISPELREKAKACTSPEELIALAKSEGYKLSDQDLEAISGGSAWTETGCKNYRDPCKNHSYGDTRANIDPAQAHAEFVNGVVDGGELD